MQIQYTLLNPLSNSNSRTNPYLNSECSSSREISLQGQRSQTYTGSYLSDSHSTRKESNQAEPPVYIIIDKNYLGFEHQSHRKTPHAPLRELLGFSPPPPSH